MKSTDTALLYLRIVVGGMLLLHNIGKMQSYNTIINSYTPLDQISSPTWFILFGVIETLAAVMIIIGWRVRLASIILITGTVFALSVYFPNTSLVTLELNAIYVFIYIYLFIAGGGYYSLDNAIDSRSSKVEN